MANIQIKLVGTSPLLMHNPRLVDAAEDEFARQLAPLTAKRKKTAEDHAHIQAIEWYGGMYEQNGRVVQPTSKVRKCIIETAKITKNGKDVERSLSMLDMYVPLEYDGPSNLDDLYRSGQFISRLSVGVGQKRVMRTRPQFEQWSLTCAALLLEDAGLDFTTLVRILQLAGRSTGIGDGRAIGYGRFTSTVEEVA